MMRNDLFFFFFSSSSSQFQRRRRNKKKRSWEGAGKWLVGFASYCCIRRAVDGSCWIWDVARFVRVRDLEGEMGEDTSQGDRPLHRA